MEDLFPKRFPVVRDEAREVMVFEILPQPFDGVEVRAVGRKVDRLDVMPVQPLGLVPAGVVENQQDTRLPFCLGVSMVMVSRNAWKTSVS